jgi:hypothetical protein
LGAYDAILGMTSSGCIALWGAIGNSKHWNFKRRGSISICRAFNRKFVKWSKGNDIWAIAVVWQVPNVPLMTEPPPPPIAQVLQDFKEMFDTPAELPPHRDHTISLLPGSSPASYRVSHSVFISSRDVSSSSVAVQRTPQGL